MSTRFRRSASHDYELLPRLSVDSNDLLTVERHVSSPSWAGRLAHKFGIRHPSAYAHFITPRRRKRSLARTICWGLVSAPFIFLFLFVFWGVFLPSYTHFPAHYEELRQRSLGSTEPGRANVYNEKVFIAATIYEENGELTSGPWGQSVLDLVDLLGPENTYLSIYENNPDDGTVDSLLRYRERTPCNNTIAYEDLDLSTLPRVALPNGETRLKRITFLAEVRNRALVPIDSAGVAFDRVLYINDVNFDPIEAAQLLFSTHIDSNGRADYGAACAVDFIQPFKFYDRFATRDLDGYTMGIPFFPWFTSAGTSTSRDATMAGSDAVPVRSCWGGMTAFEAKWFQTSIATAPALTEPAKKYSPLRFRYEEATFWESSECCLIHADLQYLRSGEGMPPESGVYMNPFIRVAYDPTTLSWLSLSRRPERLVAWIHDFLNNRVNFPTFNNRQLEEPGKEYIHTIWQYDYPDKAFLDNATAEDMAGKWVEEKTIAEPGGYCGGRNLLVINEHPQEGESHWGRVKPPAPPRR